MSSSDEQQWQRMLGELAHRDGSVELSRDANADSSAVVLYRSRVFEVLIDGGIIVQAPRAAMQDKGFAVGRDVVLTIVANEQRMVAACTLEAVLSYPINPSLKTTCYRLSPARQPRRDQRRLFYRVNVAGMPLAPIELSCETNGAKTFVCQGRLSNISAGGFGVSIPSACQVQGQMATTGDLSCTAWLSDDQCIEIPVRVAHLTERGDGGLYLGLQFAVVDPLEARQLEQQIQQRCTEIQRLQLKRRRA